MNSKGTRELFSKFNSPLIPSNNKPVCYKKTRTIGLLADNLILDGTGSTFLNSRGIIQTPEGRHFFIDALNTEIDTVSVLESWQYNPSNFLELMLRADRVYAGPERMLANTHALLRDIPNLINQPLTEKRLLSFYLAITNGVTIVINPPLNDQEALQQDQRRHEVLSYIVSRITNYEDLRLSERLLDALLMPIIFSSFKPFPTANAAVGVVVQHIMLHLLRLPLLTLAHPNHLFYAWANNISIKTSLKNINKFSDGLKEYPSYIDVTDSVQQYLEIMVDELKWLRTKLYRMTIHRSLNADALHNTRRFNARQEAILVEALLHQDAEFTLQEHQDKYRIAYSTANVDFNKLVNLGLLETTKHGHAFMYTATKEVKKLFAEITDSKHAYELMEESQKCIEFIDRDLGLKNSDFNFPNLTDKASKYMLDRTAINIKTL